MKHISNVSAVKSFELLKKNFQKENFVMTIFYCTVSSTKHFIY